VDVAAGLPFEAVFESGITGLVPGLELAIIDNVGNDVQAASAVGITEQTIDGQASTGTYAVTKTAPATAGQYTLVWSTDGSFAVGTVTVEDLVVHAVGTILPAPGMPTTQGGPCSMWADIDDIPDCCDFGDIDPATVIPELTSSMVAASEFLWFASGKQYAGSCERTVRACEDESCTCCQILSRGHIVYPWNDVIDWSECTCIPDDRIKLAGYATEIVSVEIDGVVVAADEYELREETWLVRLEGTWPCQTEVTYIYGKTPPESGRRAALKLACEVYKSCTPGAGDCELPTGVTRVTRQGVTIERAFMQRDPDGVWRTGMAAVDFFLNSVNPNGIPRRATFWSPSRRARYARG
jgi:hypothetical protein